MTRKEYESYEFKNKSVKIRYATDRIKRNSLRKGPNFYIYAFDPVSRLGTSGKVSANTHLQAARVFIESMR